MLLLLLGGKGLIREREAVAEVEVVEEEEEEEALS